MKRIALLAFAVLRLSFSQVPAQASLDAITLPTYQEGLPDFNPPFDQFQTVSYLEFVYPYTMRTNFTTKKSNESWRALKLENEYLSCVILPDLGGHVYGCLDKITGRNLFYPNGSIKKQWIGLRGAWVALGLESNFPNGHSWVSVSPVDYAFHNNPDGSASVFVGNVDRVTGMQWRCEYVLRPGVGVLEQHVTLENRSNVRRRYYFWANAAVKLFSTQDRFIVPTNVASIHGSGFVDTWPVGVSGTDWSITGSYAHGDGYFAIGSHEEYLGVYQPGTKSGLLHVASPVDVPGKKTWTWGPNDGRNLSDDNSIYVEIQGGATESQEVYYYLEPFQVRTFQENWLPIRSVGGVSNANTTAVLNLARTSTGVLAEVSVTRPIAGATLQLWQNGQMLRQSSAGLTPQQLATLSGSTQDSSAVTFRLLDNSGALILEQTEGVLNADPVESYTLGQRPNPPWSNPVTAADYAARADYNERLANYDFAWFDYTTALALFPDSQVLLNGLGRLWQVLAFPDEAAKYLNRSTSTDAEILYYGALARQDTAALTALQSDPVYGVASSVRLAQMLTLSGDNEAALTALRAGPAAQSKSVRWGAVEVALLRALGRWDEAADRLAYWTNLDPTDVNLRYESYRLGQDDGGLWSHLAADPERILNVAEHLMGLGQYAESLDVLTAGYDNPDAVELEPGIPSATGHALIWYYRGYCKEKTGQSGAAEYKTASGLSMKYIFPNRAMTLDVLNAALRVAPDDASSLWLRGCLYLSMRRTNDAIADWGRVRTLRPATLSLHRTLGRTWLDVKHDKATALPILQEGLKYEPDNGDLLNAIQRAK